MGLVTLIDDMVGRIVTALEDRGLLENTLLLFTTDHGEMMFERGRTGKGSFWESVIHAPLIAVPPGGIAGSPSGIAGGKEIEQLVETYDVAPTVLDYARAGIPEKMSASSLRPLIEGTGQGKTLALCEYLDNDRSHRGICVRTDRHKYEYWSPSEVPSGETPQQECFYDLREDPFERRNLISEARCRTEIERHRRLMIDRLIHTPA
jgi:arylsulfatase A-like enzyme